MQQYSVSMDYDSFAEGLSNLIDKFVKNSDPENEHARLQRMQVVFGVLMGIIANKTVYYDSQHSGSQITDPLLLKGREN